MRLWHHRFKDSLWYAYSYVYFRIDFALSTNYLFVVQAATHLKGLAEKAKLNEKHVRIARIYKAKVATLTSERTELQGRAQHMSEEMERLKSDLKHTSSARARAESREVEVRSSLTTTKGELREVRSELRALQSELGEFQEGLKFAQGELQMTRKELIISQGERRDLQAELRAAANDLHNKEAQLEAARKEVSENKVSLETARREYSEAANSLERLGEECHGLRADLLQQSDMVTQRDEVIRQLRDQAGAQWASGWLAFQQKATRAYPDLDFDFDVPSDGEAEESFDTNESPEPNAPTEAPSHSSSSET